MTLLDTYLSQLSVESLSVEAEVVIRMVSPLLCDAAAGGSACSACLVQLFELFLQSATECMRRKGLPEPAQEGFGCSSQEGVWSYCQTCFLGSNPNRVPFLIGNQVNSQPLEGS